MIGRYLLRFDDFCPTMNWDIWAQVEDILLQFDVKPILSVVPDNQDQTLKVCQAKEKFWDDVRTWQNRGWTIGLHGYQHRYVTQDAGIIGIKGSSEFSGLPYEEQFRKLQLGKQIFERENITPNVWVAPGHSFDETTVKALQALGIRYISDGLNIYPHLDSANMTWVPQQFWRFRWMPFGVWTVCHHINAWTTNDITKFRSDIQSFRSAIISFTNVVASHAKHRGSWLDRPYAKLYLTALKVRRLAFR